MTTKTANFVFDAQRIEITMETERNYFSLTGTAPDGSSGQVQDTLRTLYSESATLCTPFDEVLEVWETYHLQPLATVPADAIERATKALEVLDGSIWPQDREGGKADDFEESDISEGQDVIDSRDVINRIEYLRDFLGDLSDEERTLEAYDPAEDANGDRSEAVEELLKLEALEEQAENYAADWRYGETLIADDHFETYAEQYAEDIGAVNRDATWPNNHIDWTAAAADLRQDYTSVKFGKTDYWIR